MNKADGTRFSRMTRAVPILVIAVTLLTSLSSRATPMDEWPVKFHPHLDLAATYDDNILISHSNVLSDVIFTLRPGLELDYGEAPHNHLSLDYTAGIERYVDHGSQDAVNHYVELKGVFNFSRLKLQIQDQFADETAANVQAGARVEEERNIAQLGTEYLLNKYFSAGLLLHTEYHHFVTPGQIDYNLYQPGVAWYYHALPKADVYGEFDYGWIDEQRGEDRQLASGSMGLRGKITGKISGQIGVGYENLDYSGKTPSVDGVISSVSLHGDFTRHTSADLAISRQINPSITSQNDSYTSTRVDFTVIQKIYYEKFKATVGGSYERDEYDEPISQTPKVTRDDDLWQAHAGIRYIARKWLELGASYSYQWDHSTVGTLSFQENVVTLDALLRY